MCYFVRSSSESIQNIEAWLLAVGLIEKLQLKDWKFGELNAFAHPYLPVVTNADTDRVQLFRWGLIPKWSKDEEIAKHTANARLETITEKPSFRSSVDNRCLVIVDGFYEWQWLDDKGKKKQKFLLTMPHSEPFALGGLWNVWKAPHGASIPTFTVLTTDANTLMSEIHNTKKRMPTIVARGAELDWLQRGQLHLGNDSLQATAL